MEEIQDLIKFKSENLDKITISRYVNREDIYNACERRKLSKVDLDRIMDNLERTLGEEYGITIIPHTDKLKNIAKFSKEYEVLKRIRNSHKAALHDAMAILYVKEKRGKNIREFEKVNCWFVNNSISHDIDNGDIDTLINSNQVQNQPEIIKADNLLNILWMSNPNINIALANSDLVDMGLTSLVAFTLNESLPKARIIRELDDNIQKYKTSDITDRDVYLLSNRIANNQIKSIEKLNELAIKDVKEFNRRIKEEATKQANVEKERAQKLDTLFREMKSTIENLDDKKKEVERRIEKKKEKEIEQITAQNQIALKAKEDEIAKLKAENIEKENAIRTSKRNDLINRKIEKWRIKSWIWLIIVGLLLIVGIIWIFNANFFEINNFINQKIVAIVFSVLSCLFESVVIKSLYDKYQNHSNINAYKNSIQIPDDLNPV
jgi:hypothetical protein